MIAPTSVRRTHSRFCQEVLAVPRAIIENWTSRNSGEIHATLDMVSNALCTSTRALVLSTSVVYKNSWPRIAMAGMVIAAIQTLTFFLSSR